MKRLRANLKTLHLLQNTTPAIQKSILEKAPKKLVECFCECAKNILSGNLPLSSRNKQKLCYHKKGLRDLAKRSVPLKSKQKIIQKGGFLSTILGVLSPIIGGLLGGLTK